MANKVDQVQLLQALTDKLMKTKKDEKLLRKVLYSSGILTKKGAFSKNYVGLNKAFSIE